ncbi:uncharacterized protein LOC116347298 [Contarinia nasturtii]|uniref:uncharacterized protein LOC116347298 n=1 Tax=Contarinia nasturtii TaxID=265458 RepID=UPI0012D44DFC|nr:uncharacterized protein LOC116347298 [Contarinia nasturtii]
MSKRSREDEHSDDNDHASKFKLPAIFDGKYFKIISHDKDTKKISAKCNQCTIKDKIIRGQTTSTGNFYTHYKLTHINYYIAMRDYCKGKTDRRMTTANEQKIQSLLPFSMGSLDFNRVRELTLSFVASTNSAFRIVENKEFIKLIEYVSQTKASIPTTQTLMSDLNEN